MIPKEVLQPFVLVMLIVMAVYTLMKKQFGQKLRMAASREGNHLFLWQ
jgi:uncharacterized membrane protein YfcA